MQFKHTGFAGLFLIELDLARDERGYFARTFCMDTFKEHGLQTDYPQNGTSFNAKAGYGPRHAFPESRRMARSS